MDDTNKKGQMKNSRRKFLNILLGSSFSALLISVFYPLIKFLIPPASKEAKPSTVLAAQLEELKPNSGKIFRFGNMPGIIIKTENSKIRAFSAVCTHLDCTVQYREDLQHIWCACHNGHYDLNGINIQGPPPRPLTQYDVIINKDKIYASKRA